MSEVGGSIAAGSDNDENSGSDDMFAAGMAMGGGMGGGMGFGGGFAMKKKKKKIAKFPWNKEPIEYPLPSEDRWMNDKGCSSVYSSRYKRFAGGMPLFYTNVEGKQILDFHIKKGKDDNTTLLEKGAYSADGQLVLGVQIKIECEWPKEEDGTEKPRTEETEPTKRTVTLYAGEFKDGLLHGLGRKFLDNWWFTEGTFEAAEIKYGTLWSSQEADGGQAYYGIRKEDKEVQVRFYQDAMRYNKPERQEIWTYKDEKKDGMYFDSYIADQGKARNKFFYEADARKDKEEDVKPEQDACDKYLDDELEANEDLKAFYNQDEDIRDFYGMNRDPIHYMPNQTVNKKWKVVKKIEIMKEYLVEDVNPSSASAGKTLIMACFKSQMDMKSVMRLYERYKGPEDVENNLKGIFKSNVNAIYDVGEFSVGQLESKKMWFIVLSQPKTTLKDILEDKENKLDYLSKLNIFIQLTKELKKIHKGGFQLYNMNPANIELNEEKNQFFFTQFYQAQTLPMGANRYKYYPAVDHYVKPILLSKPAMVKVYGDNLDYIWYKTYNCRPENGMQLLDDIQAFMYIIAEVFNGTLPWTGMDNATLIQDKKSAIKIEEFFDKDTDDDFFNVCKYLFQMAANVKPDYEKVVDELKVVKDKFALPREDNKFIWQYKEKQEDQKQSGEDDIPDGFGAINESVRQSSTKTNKTQKSFFGQSKVFDEDDEPRHTYNSIEISQSFKMPKEYLDVIQTQHNIFDKEYRQLLRDKQSQNDNYWSMPKRNKVTEKNLAEMIPFELAVTATKANSEYIASVNDLNSKEEQLALSLRKSVKFEYNFYTDLKKFNRMNAKSELIPFERQNLKMLMKDPQYHLFGILKLRKLKKYIQEKNIENVRCYRCAGELKDKYDYVWVNEFNVLCTDCHQDSKQIEQLIKELNHNPFHLPHYEGDDWARIDSILDKVGGSLQYKDKAHSYSYTCVQQMDWQLNLHRDKKKIQVVEDLDIIQWAKVIGNPNCQVHAQYKNIALTIIGNKEKDDTRFLKLSYQKKDIMSVMESNLRKKLSKDKEEEKKLKEEEEKKKQGEEKKEGEEEQVEDDEEVVEEENSDDEESNICEAYLPLDKWSDFTQNVEPIMQRPQLFYDPVEGKLTVQSKFMDNSKLEYIRLTPMFESENKRYTKHWIIPTTNVYKEDKKDIFKQVFALCFSYEQMILQTFSVVIQWGNDVKKSDFELTNSRIFVGLHVKDVRPNITEHGIDGLLFKSKSAEEKKFRWLSFRRTRPYEYGFKNNVSFNRYSKYFETLDSGIAKIYVLEAQLTDVIVRDQDNISQYVLLMNSLRTLTNMVPDKIKRDTLVKDMNWFQPLEILSGRSMSQYCIGSKQVGQKVDMYTLKAGKGETLFEKIKRDLSLTDHPTFNQIFDDEFNLQSHEINFDFSYRTAVHDCLDFENPTLVVDYRSTILQYLEEIYFDSNTASQVYMGLFGLVMEMETPIEEFDQFIMDVGEEKKQRIYPELQSDLLPVTSDDQFYLIKMNTVACINYDNDLFCEKALARLDESQKEGSVKVNHFVSDWTLSFVQTKHQRFLDVEDKGIQMIRNEELVRRENDEEDFRKKEWPDRRTIVFDFFDKQGFMCDYDVAIFTKRINELYGGDVEQQKCFKLFVDSQFKSTSKIIIRLFIMYFVFFVGAFLWQMFSTDHSTIVCCNVSCLIMQLILVLIESLQFQYKGLGDYFKDIWNYFDIAHFIMYTIYFFMRVLIYSNHEGGVESGILPSRDPNVPELTQDGKEELVKWVFIHSLIILLIAFKLMFFMRVNEDFSNLVELVSSVFSQIGPFTVFLAMWMIVNSLLYNISGIQIVSYGKVEDSMYQQNVDSQAPMKVQNAEDYDHVDASIALILQNFRNSVGDIAVPTYDYWIPDKDSTVGYPLANFQIGMVGWAWMLFLFNEFFILIVLLNFLIAIIGQSYDEVMSKQEIDRYKQRCDLNIEVSIMTDTAAKLGIYGQIETESKRVFYLLANTYHKDDENEFQGFVKTIKQAIKKQNRILKDDIKKCFPNADLLGNFADKFSSISNLDYTVESKLNDVKREINSRMNDMSEKNGELQNQIGEIKLEMTKGMSEIKALLKASQQVANN